MEDGTYYSSAIRTKELIGRKREKDDIQAAIQDVGTSHILFIIGQGGIGKTRLLEEIAGLISQWCQGEELCVSSKIIDLYDTAKHSSGGIEQAIIEGIDPNKKGFPDYRERRQRFERRRAAYIGEKRLAEERQALTDIFVEDYNAIARRKRLVLILDTVEVIQYENEAIQKIIGEETTGAEARAWLINNLGKLQNSAIVLAGRPTTRLFDDLEAGSGAPVVRLDLGGFAEDETLSYFEAMAESQPELEEFLSTHSDLPRIVHICTAGRPIMLALTIDLMARGSKIVDEVFSLSLEEASKKTASELEAIRGKIESALVEEIQNVPESVYPALLRYVGWARKGINVELLSRLLEKPEAECQTLLDELEKLSFVKTRGTQGVDDGKLVFFHDEMYALMDRYVLKEPAERDAFCRKVIAYYDEKIRGAEGRLRQDLQIERLYYQLLQNPKKGYENYCLLADEAILARDFGFDMRLRDEMLRFLNEPSNRGRALSYKLDLEEVDRESALRWIGRWTHRGDYDKAKRVVERIRASVAPTFRILHVVEDRYAEEIPAIQQYHKAAGTLGKKDDSSFTLNDILFVAGLYVNEGEVMAYAGKDVDKAVGLLGVPIRLLEEQGPDLDKLGPRDDEPHETVRWADFLGVSYNNLGYAYTRLRNYDKAAECYGRASRCLRWAGNKIQLAHTLNNWAFVYSQRGETRRGIRVCEDALDLRRKLGHSYSIGLSLNTLGLINIADNELEKAEGYCREALRVFESEQVGDARGVGLACNALSQALRRLGVAALKKESGPDLAKAEQYFQEAEAQLQRSVEIFAPDSKVHDFFRLAEAYNESGCTYRDWGDLFLRQGNKDQAKKYYRLAEQALQQSLDTTTDEMQSERADDYEDLADVYLRLGDGAKLSEMLKRFEEMIPDKYKIVSGQGIPDIEEPVSKFWLSLGKNSLLRVRVAWAQYLQKDLPEAAKQERLQEAIKQVVIASAYFERYSQETTALDTTIDLVYEQLKTLSFHQLQNLHDYALKVVKEYNLGPVRMLNAIEDALGE